MSNLTPVPIVRLTPEVYAAFAKQFRPLVPNEQTSILQAGHALGVETVLKALREQLTLSASS